MSATKKWTGDRPNGLKVFDKIEGERCALSKVGLKLPVAGEVEQIEPEYCGVGYFSLVDREGAPSVYLTSLSEWYITSEVVSAKKISKNKIEFETLNSIYLLKVHD